MNGKNFYVYILASFTQTLYIGVTNDLARRIQEHKEKVEPNSFKAKYNVNRLVYYEYFGSAKEAIMREKQIKSYRREKKIALIETSNANWSDLLETNEMKEV